MVWTHVAEGDGPVREAERLILEESGYAVEEARDVNEALALLRRCPRAGVAVVDAMLPGGGAAPVLRAALADPSLRRHRYVFTTTLPLDRLPAEAREAVKALEAEVIEKPFDIDAFVATVDRVAKRLLAGVRMRCG